MRKFLFFSFLFFSFPSGLFACSCNRMPDEPLKQSIERAFENYDAIFVGEVESIELDKERIKIGKPGRFKIINFDVKRVWKGDVGNNFKVFTYGTRVSCGFYFIESHEYLVFSEHNKQFYKDGSLKDIDYGVNSCSPTTEFHNQIEEVAILDELLSNNSKSKNSIR